MSEAKKEYDADEAREAAWIEGNRAAWLNIYQRAGDELGETEAVIAARAREMHDARRAVKEIMEEIGIGDDFEEDLHLGDLIEKCLGRYVIDKLGGSP